MIRYLSIVSAGLGGIILAAFANWQGMIAMAVLIIISVELSSIADEKLIREQEHKND